MSRSNSNARPYTERTFRNVRSIEPRNNLLGSGPIFDLQQSANDMLVEFLDVVRSTFIVRFVPLSLGRALRRQVNLEVLGFETYLQTLINGEAVFSDIGSLYNQVITRLRQIDDRIPEAGMLVSAYQRYFHEIYVVVISAGSVQRRRADHGYDSTRLGRSLYDDEL